jgi:hypothetical protein
VIKRAPVKSAQAKNQAKGGLAGRVMATNAVRSPRLDRNDKKNKNKQKQKQKQRQKEKQKQKQKQRQKEKEKEKEKEKKA